MRYSPIRSNAWSTYLSRGAQFTIAIAQITYKCAMRFFATSRKGFCHFKEIFRLLGSRSEGAVGATKGALKFPHMGVQPFPTIKGSYIIHIADVGRVWG